MAKIPSLQEQPVQSAITVPTPDAKVPLNESLTVMGYAYSGGGRGEGCPTASLRLVHK